jgi:ribosomal protein S18 acetylase RimI-like enzyme
VNSNPVVEIREAVLGDASVLSEIGSRTFYETFAKDNDPKDMENYLRETFRPEIQVQEILDPSRTLFLASEQKVVVGYAHLQAKSTFIELIRLYVDSRWHGKGIAHQLMQACIDKGQQLGFSALRLGVWEKNRRAQSFYRKWDFQVIGEQAFILGKDRQRDLVLEKKF